MATPRSTRLLALGLASAAAVAFLPAAGHADPRPTLAQVQQRVDALNAQADVLIEQYAEAKIALAAASQRAAVAQARVQAAQAQLAAVRRSMSSVVAAAYLSGGGDQFVDLVTTSTPQTFLDRAASLDRIAAGQSEQLARAATARHRLDAAQQDAATQAAAQQALSSKLAGEKRQIEGLLSQQEQLLGSLKADQRRQLEAAARQAQQRASRSRSFSVPAYTGPVSGRASVAIAEAKRQLGKPYQWGGAGPNSFDCSGLMMWAWARAGVSLPHSAAAQYDQGTHVSQSDLQPGDLVFFGSPIHHVGMYLGGGQMIDAPHSGAYVEITGVYWNEYVGATRL